jgi:hypothetical protein
MGFMTGRISYVRFKVDGPLPGLFGPEHLERLAVHAIGRQRLEAKDGVEAGWIAGEDILDLGFDLAKNVIADCLHFSLRLDTQKLPGDLLRAYAREELQGLAAANPSGRPSASQRKQAKEMALLKLEAEAKDGRFTRRKAYPVLWDGQANQALVGTSSAGVLDQAQRLFKETFNSALTPLDAGKRALVKIQGEAELQPSFFLPAGEPYAVAWCNDPTSPTYLGNEWLLWLWFTLETAGDLIALGDGSEVTVMMARSLVLECPRGITGSEAIRSAGPTRLPEARRAVQAGKLPRQAGLILVRHDYQCELTLQAETLAVSGAKLPPAEEKGRAALEERVTQIRNLLGTLDLLYDAFLQRRLGKDWTEELARMRRWLQREDGPRLAATA